jgi:hypothetical protein
MELVIITYLAPLFVHVHMFGTILLAVAQAKMASSVKYQYQYTQEPTD